jgi:hypothetical protein
MPVKLKDLSDRAVVGHGRMRHVTDKAAQRAPGMDGRRIITNAISDLSNMHALNGFKKAKRPLLRFGRSVAFVVG